MARAAEYADRPWLLVVPTDALTAATSPLLEEKPAVAMIEVPIVDARLEDQP
jgi:hypothetical protein